MIRNIGLISICAVMILLTSFAVVFADGGVLTAYSGWNKPEQDAILLSRMEVRVEVDNGMAEVSVLQIYQNLTDKMLEGRYTFMIPETAELSNFAIWEDSVRIPGVIVEKKRAREIYEELHARIVDPGLMESDDEENVNLFSCRVFPIPSYGTKRLELSYTQVLPVQSEKMFFSYPCKPATYKTQKAQSFEFTFDFQSDTPFGTPNFLGETLVPKIENQSKEGFVAHFSAEDIALTENVDVEIPMPVEKPQIRFLTYRDVDRVWRNISPLGGRNYQDETGFFAARALFAKDENGNKDAPMQLVLALDTSLSMQWDKLDRALEMAYYLISHLRQGDTFTVVTFNAQANAMSDKVMPFSEDVAAKAEQWIRRQNISGGTDFTKLFDAIAKRFEGDTTRRVALLTDGAPTLTKVNPEEIANSYEKSNLKKAKARMYIVGIGDDANRSLLSDLASRGGGPYLWLASTEDYRHKAQVMVDRLSAQIYEQVRFELVGGKSMDHYPSRPGVAFGGESFDFVGRYNKTGKATAKVTYQVGQQKKTIEQEVQLPKNAVDHEGLRRRWAKARVMNLLDMINREGEQKEWIDEIIALSKEFTFVTPYTSFIAAPRSLLRPRFIRPGDPILRVRTDPRIRQVVASFPFGLTEKMKYLPEEDIWQLRFLAPPGWPDGAYDCVLYLTDDRGQRYAENKRFVIDGSPPKIFPEIKGPWVAGQKVQVVARADQDTRRLTVKGPGIGYVELRYDHERLASVGTAELPAQMSDGQYVLEWFAEDFAHNVTRTTSVVEVQGVGHE